MASPAARRSYELLQLVRAPRRAPRTVRRRVASTENWLPSTCWLSAHHAHNLAPSVAFGDRGRGRLRRAKPRYHRAHPDRPWSEPACKRLGHGSRPRDPGGSRPDGASARPTRHPRRWHISRALTPPPRCPRNHHGLRRGNSGHLPAASGVRMRRAHRRQGETLTIGSVGLGNSVDWRAHPVGTCAGPLRQRNRLSPMSSRSAPTFWCGARHAQQQTLRSSRIGAPLLLIPPTDASRDGGRDSALLDSSRACNSAAALAHSSSADGRLLQHRHGAGRGGSADEGSHTKATVSSTRELTTDPVSWTLSEHRIRLGAVP